VKAWFRTVRLIRGGDERVEVADAWHCEAPPTSLALHLLISGDVRIEPDGRATVSPPDGRALLLSWDPAVFDAEAETIALTDPAFTAVWGPALHRLILTARRPTAEGHHRLVARPLADPAA
jgi:hypothetical protein